MATILNKKNWFDTNIFHMLDAHINTSNYMWCWVSDQRRYIYNLIGYGGVLFYKFDIFSKSFTQLASAPVAASTSTSYQSDMTYDPIRNRIYCSFWGSNDFRYYDIEQNVWSAALTALPAANGVWWAIRVVWDFIYYIQGNASSRRLYRYWILTNAWTEASLAGTWVAVAAWWDIIPSWFAPANMAKIINPTGIDADRLYIVIGWATRYIREFKISTVASIGIHEMKSTTATYSAGSSGWYCPETNELFWNESGNRNINKSKLYLWSQETGTATGWTTSTLINTSKVWEDNKWSRMFYVTITAGTGVGNTRQITDNTNNTLSVYPNFSIAPDATSVYEIKGTVLDYGTATAVGTNSLTDSTKSTIWLANTYRYAKIKIVYGTGIGQERFIASHTTTVITVDANWTVLPDNTSKYEIIGMKTYPASYLPVTTSVSYLWDTMEWFNMNWVVTVFTYRKNGQSDWGYFQDMTP